MNIKNKDLFILSELYSEIQEGKLADSIAGKPASGSIINPTDVEGDEELANDDDLYVASKSEDAKITDALTDAEVLARAKKLAENRNIPMIGRKQMLYYIARAFINKRPLMVFGDPGTSKTQSVAQIAREISLESTVNEFITSEKMDEMITGGAELPEGNVPKEFINWNSIDDEEKNRVFANPEKYFIFVDLNVEGLDRLSFGGTPVTGATPDKIQRYNKDQNLVVICNPKAEGMVFLDELNLSKEDISPLFMKLFQARTVGDQKLSDGISLIAAGNYPSSPEARTQVSELSDPLKSRMTGGTFGLILDPEEWCDWADEMGLYPMLVNYIREDTNRFITPWNLSEVTLLTPTRNARGFQAFSDSIKKTIKLHKMWRNKGGKPPNSFLGDIENAGNSIVEHGFGTNFIKYWRDATSWNLEKVLSHSSLGRDRQQTTLTNQEVHHVSSFIHNHLNSCIKKLEKNLEFKEIFSDNSTRGRNAALSFITSMGEKEKEDIVAVFTVLTRLDEETAFNFWGSLKQRFSSKDKKHIFNFLQAFAVLGGLPPDIKKEVVKTLEVSIDFLTPLK